MNENTHDGGLVGGEVDTKVARRTGEGERNFSISAGE